MASSDTDVPDYMRDRGKWYGDAADYWKVRNEPLSVRFFYWWAFLYHALYLSLLASIFCVEIEGSASVIVAFYLLVLKELCHEIYQNMLMVLPPIQIGWKIK